MPSGEVQSKTSIETLHKTGKMEHFINALVWMLHEPQYKASISAQRAMKTSKIDCQAKKALEHWPSTFTGQTWILNRTTPPHRDQHGFNAGFDFLSVGGVAKALMHVRDINLSCAYNPGTVVAIAGRVLSHEVSTVEDGDRIAIARWVRKTVLLKYGISGGSCKNMGNKGESKDEEGLINEDDNDLEWSTLTSFRERLAECFVNP